MTTLNTQNLKTAEDESIIRKELSRADPSAVVMGESWAAKKVRLCCGVWMYASLMVVVGRVGYGRVRRMDI